MKDMLKRIESGDSAPKCEECKTGILKPDTISFGQALDNEVLQQAKEALQRCDLLIVMGTSLGTFLQFNNSHRSGSTCQIFSKLCS